MDNSKLTAHVAVFASLVAVFAAVEVTLWYDNRGRGNSDDKNA